MESMSIAVLLTLLMSRNQARERVKVKYKRKVVKTEISEEGTALPHLDRRIVSENEFCRDSLTKKTIFQPMFLLLFLLLQNI